MDVPKLKLIFTGLASLAATAGPTILLLGPNPSAGAGACALSPDDISTVQRQLAGRNASCTFNMTLDEILTM